MLSLRLKIVLPTVQTIAQAGLWYWAVHSVPTGIFAGPALSAGWSIGLALNAPCAFIVSAIFVLAGGTGGLTSVEFQLLFIACVAVFWYLVGTWLGKRSSPSTSLPPHFLVGKRLAIALFGLRICMLALGVFFVFLAYKERGGVFRPLLSKILLLAWATAFIAIPAIALARWLKNYAAPRLANPNLKRAGGAGFNFGGKRAE